MKRKMIFLLLILSLSLIFVGCGDQIEGPKVDQEEPAKTEGFTKLNTTDIYGNEVTQDIFKDYTLTMVNVWGTFCGPCLEEMPYLGEIQNEYQNRGVNIIGIVVDVQDNNLKVIDKQLKLAQEIAVGTGADYTHLIVNPEMIDVKIGEIDAIPATFFVDGEGNFVGETYVGGREKEDWIDIIEKTLEEYEK